VRDHPEYISFFCHIKAHIASVIEVSLLSFVTQKPGPGGWVGGEWGHTRSPGKDQQVLRHWRRTMKRPLAVLALPLLLPESRV